MHRPISAKHLFSNSEESYGNLDEVCDVIVATDKLVKVKDCAHFHRSDDGGINQRVQKNIDHPQDYCGEIESNGKGFEFICLGVLGSFTREIKNFLDKGT